MQACGPGPMPAISTTLTPASGSGALSECVAHAGDHDSSTVTSGVAAVRVQRGVLVAEGGVSALAQRRTPRYSGNRGQCMSWTTAWPLPRRDQPAVDRHGHHEGDRERDRQAPPEQAGRPGRRAIAPGTTRISRLSTISIVVIETVSDGEREPDALARRSAVAAYGGEGQQVAEEERQRRPRARCWRRLPQPHQVASTMPSTSPIAQPVRQCSVALTAVDQVA